MLSALYYIIWIELRTLRNTLKSRTSEYVLKVLIVCPFLFFAAWLFGDLFFVAQNLIVSGNNQVIKELGHLLCTALGLVWLVLALQTNLGSLSYDHLFRMSALSWNFKSIFAAALIRSLGDRWLIFWVPILLWMVLSFGITPTLYNILIVTLAIILFGLTMAGIEH